MKKIITFLILIISLSLFSQKRISIKGKLFFSQEFYTNFSNLLVKIDGSKEYIKIKEDGKFEIITPTKKKNYKLQFYYGNILFREFNYEHKWTNRDRVKSISLATSCEVSKSVARKEFKEKKKFRIYIFNRLDTLILSKKDKKFQKETNSKFVKITYCDINKFECYLDYNLMIYKHLLFSNKRNYLDKIRKDVIGYRYINNN